MHYSSTTGEIHTKTPYPTGLICPHCKEQQYREAIKLHVDHCKNYMFFCCNYCPCTKTCCSVPSKVCSLWLTHTHINTLSWNQMNWSQCWNKNAPRLNTHFYTPHSLISRPLLSRYSPTHTHCKCFWAWWKGTSSQQIVFSQLQSSSTLQLQVMRLQAWGPHGKNNTGQSPPSPFWGNSWRVPCI